MNVLCGGVSRCAIDEGGEGIGCIVEADGHMLPVARSGGEEIELIRDIGPREIQVRSRLLDQPSLAVVSKGVLAHQMPVMHAINAKPEFNGEVLGDVEGRSAISGRCKRASGVLRGIGKVQCSVRA